MLATVHWSSSDRNSGRLELFADSELEVGLADLQGDMPLTVLQTWQRECGGKEVARPGDKEVSQDSHELLLYVGHG